MGKEIFTRGPYDTWNGQLQHFGESNFSVIGVCCNDPVIAINHSKNHVQAEQCVIKWNTGKVVKFLSPTNMPLQMGDYYAG